MSFPLDVAFLDASGGWSPRYHALAARRPDPLAQRTRATPSSCPRARWPATGTVNGDTIVYTEVGS